MTSQFWNITQCRLVVNYRRFRTTDRSDLQGFSIEVYHGYSLWIIFKHATALINTSDLIFVNGLHEIWEGVDYWLAARLLASPRLSLCSRKVIFFFFPDFCPSRYHVHLLPVYINSALSMPIMLLIVVQSGYQSRWKYKFCSSPQRSDRACGPPSILPDRYRVLVYRMLFSGR